MCPIWWDNGAEAAGSDGFGLLDREANPGDWHFGEIVTGLVNGAVSGSSL
jgi:hypothetical protein